MEEVELPGAKENFLKLHLRAKSANLLSNSDETDKWFYTYSILLLTRAGLAASALLGFTSAYVSHWTVALCAFWSIFSAAVWEMIRLAARSRTNILSKMSVLHSWWVKFNNFIYLRLLNELTSTGWMWLWHLLSVTWQSYDKPTCFSNPRSHLLWVTGQNAGFRAFLHTSHLFC